jgi:hypothetical protein
MALRLHVTNDTDRSMRRGAAAAALGILLCSAPASAQLDPLLFLKATAPNVILVVDTSNRMQRDAPDPATGNSNYYDPAIYNRDLTKAWQTATLGISAVNTAAFYRRKYTNFVLGAAGTFTTSTIQITHDLDAGSAYTAFEAPTRMSIARAALYQAVNENQNVARFGLIQMRHNNALITSPGGSVADTDPAQSSTNPLVKTDNTLGTGPWKISRPTTGGSNGGAPATTAPLVHATAATANTDVLNILLRDVRLSSTQPTLLPAGNDDVATQDTPVHNMLADTETELTGATGILSGDLACRNTVVVLVVGGGEGNTTAFANSDLGTIANDFTNQAGHKVPIYVIAIAPPASDVDALKAIATNSKGQYFEITKAQIDAALASPMAAACAATPVQPCATAPTGTVVVPEMVKAVSLAIQHAFASSTDVNSNTMVSLPSLPFATSTATEFQTTSPIIGTVNLEGAKDITGSEMLPKPSTVKDRALNVIPQRSNLLVTTGFTVPGFDMQLRGFRVYKAVVDDSQPSGWKFTADGTRMWVACAPGTKDSSGNDCATGTTTDQRNLYTVLPDGTMTAVTVANAATLAPHMNLTVADATAVISYFRSLPLGAVIDSTPAIMNPPSLDPPPDATYPAFIADNKDRRSMIFVGTNRGILEAIDSRLGREVWGFVPYNLLPKLRTLRDGQSVGAFDYLVDGSPKIADFKLVDDTWHTMLVFGQGPGGTFYTALDVTLDDIALTVPSTSDDLNALLTYFNQPTRIPVAWTYPLLGNFDPKISTTTMPYGDIASWAQPLEKKVGQTWSDPAIGQIKSNTTSFVVLVGSGFLPYSTQQQANRGGLVAGTTFYMIRAYDGRLIDTRDAGNDGGPEETSAPAGDNCVLANNCSRMKNALQSDPVATGPADSRFISMAYIGDLDGRVWRFDFDLDTNVPPGPIFKSGANPTKLYEDTANHQPIFSSMATVNVGGVHQYIFFGTGSDLLPSNGVSQAYKLVGVLDNGATGTVTFNPILLKVDGSGDDEKVTAFPAVAGDIVFFTTTSFKPQTPCTAPDAKLYALTFIGGPAYDTNADNKFDNSDSTLVKTLVGVRATAPFIVDQHLVFGAGTNLQMFGDKDDFNNGVGQAGVRILSWREIR